MSATRNICSHLEDSYLEVQIKNTKNDDCGHASASLVVPGQPVKHLSLSGNGFLAQGLSLTGLPVPAKFTHDPEEDKTVADRTYHIPLHSENVSQVVQSIDKIKEGGTQYSLYGKQNPLMLFANMFLYAQAHRVERVTGSLPPTSLGKTHSCVSSVKTLVEKALGEQLGSVFTPSSLGDTLEAKKLLVKRK